MANTEQNAMLFPRRVREPTYLSSQEKLPTMPTLIRAIKAVPIGDELLEILQGFPNIIRLSRMYNENKSNTNMNALKKDWEEFQNEHEEIRQLGVSAEQFRLEVEAVKPEIEHPTCGFELKKLLGLSVLQEYVLKSMLELDNAVDGKYMKWIEQVITNQPIHLDHPSDYEDYSQSKIKPFHFPALTNSLQQSLYDESLIDGVINLFVQLASNLERFLTEDNEYCTSSPVFQNMENMVVQSMSQDISNLMSLEPLDFRQALSGINLRGVLRHLTQQAKDILEHNEGMNGAVSLNDYLLKWVLLCAVVPFTHPVAEGKIRAVIHLDEEWTRILHRTPDILPHMLAGFSGGVDDDDDDDEDEDGIEEHMNEQWIGVHGAEDEYDEYDDNDDDGYYYQEFNPHDLSDVQFEPCGPDLNIQDFASAVPVDRAGEKCSICQFALGRLLAMQPAVCQHKFHAHCLHELVNGIHNYCNKCPDCRRDMCGPRGRCKVDEEDTGFW